MAVVLAGHADVVFKGKTFLPIGVTWGTYGTGPFAAGYQGQTPPEIPEIDAGAEAWFVHPNTFQERRALASGTLPFWNAHNGLGWPLLADGQIATLSPLHWIELIRPDWPWLWDLHQLLLRLLAALFTCYLVWRLGARPAVAAAGAPIAALHGTFSALVIRGDLNAYALFPCLLFCVLRLRQEVTWQRAAWLLLPMYLVLTSGHPQPAAAVLLSAALVAAGLVPGPPRALRFLGFAALASGATILMGAPYWLPLVRDIGASWSVHFRGLGLYSKELSDAVQWIVPGAFSARKPFAFLDRPAQAWTFLGGLGSTVAALGIAAPFLLPAARRRLPWLLAAAVIALKVFGFGPIQWVGKLPFLEQMQFSYFWFSLLYLLAICGLCAISDLLDAPPGRRALLAAAAVMLIVEALVAAPLVRRAGMTALSPAYPRQVFIYGNLALLAGVLVWAAAAARSSVLRNLCLAALGAGLLVELAAYRYPLSTRGNPSAIPPFATWLLHEQEKAPFRVMGMNEWLMPDTASAFGLDDVRLCDALVPKEYVAFIQRYFERDLLYGWLLFASPQRGFKLPEGMLNLLNVRYLVTHPSLIPDFVGRNRIAYTDPEMKGGALVENLHVWPRIYAVQSPDVVASPEAALERLGELDASAPFAVVASDFPRARWNELCRGCGKEPFHQRVSRVAYGINDLSFEVEVSGPSVLVVSDSLTEGWRAFVDGREQPVFRANYLFRGLLVEAGAHSVRYAYEPPGWRAAVRLFLAGLGLLAICAAFIVRARLSSFRASRPS